jgi:hypothetical protein
MIVLIFSTKSFGEKDSGHKINRDGSKNRLDVS